MLQLLPIEPTAANIPSATTAAMRAYSVAVVPDSLAANRLSNVTMGDKLQRFNPSGRAAPRRACGVQNWRERERRLATALLSQSVGDRGELVLDICPEPLHSADD